MSAHLSEEEQIEAIKRWWKENGTAILAALVICGGGFLGWNQYQSHQEKKAQQGAVLYENLVQAAQELENEDATDIDQNTFAESANKILEEQSGTLYADFANLMLAKNAVEKEDLDAAAGFLHQVIDGGQNKAMKDLARLRLARVLAAKGEFDKALQMLSGNVDNAYKTAYSEARGDIYVMQNNIEAARTAYQAALEGAQGNSRGLLQMKISNTEVATAKTESAPAVPAGHPALPEGHPSIKAEPANDKVEEQTDTAEDA